MIAYENIAATEFQHRCRKPTVEIKLGKVSISKHAFELGLFLALLQLLDGILTYIGLSLYGIHMEGNLFLRELMHIYGAFPALLMTKSFAISCVTWLTFKSHSKRWIRPTIGFLSGIYLILAVIPWTYLISAAQH